MRTGNEWTIGQVHREAAAGRLPVCFAFDGELILASVDKQWGPAGKAPRCLDFDGTVRSLTLPAKGQIAGFGCLVELLEVFRSKFSHVNGKAIKGIQLPTEFLHHGRILPGHNVLCWIEDVEIAAEAFLFHPDDLTRLIAPSQNSETPAPVIAANVNPASLGKGISRRWTTEELAKLTAYRHENGTRKAAAHFGITEQRIRQLLPRKKPTPNGYSVFNRLQG